MHELAEVLEPDEHMIVALRLFGQRDEMHFREIGTTMGLSAAETRQRVDGAREKVRDWYEHQRRPDGGVGFSRPLGSNAPTRVQSAAEEHGAWVSADRLFRDDEPAHGRVTALADAPDLLQVLQRQEQAVWDRLLDGALPQAGRHKASKHLAAIQRAIETEMARRSRDTRPVEDAETLDLTWEALAQYVTARDRPLFPFAGIDQQTGARFDYHVASALGHHRRAQVSQVVMQMEEDEQPQRPEDPIVGHTLSRPEAIWCGPRVGTEWVGE